MSTPIKTTVGPEHLEMSTEEYDRLRDRLAHAEQYFEEALKAIQGARELVSDDEDEE